MRNVGYYSLAPTLIIAATLWFPRTAVEGRWSSERAQDWYKQIPWLAGCNFIPSTAINQLEMWQEETFDPTTIDRELEWAGQLGFNTVRVYLHDIPWRDDAEGFLQRIERFLKIAERHGIRPMFVIFDGVWDPEPRAGAQRNPRPHVHNSGWVQSPGAAVLKDPRKAAELEPYVKGVIGRFRNDKRVLAWDLFNEPENSNRGSYPKTELPNKTEAAFHLLRLSFQWARQVRPRQPLTAAVWKGNWRDLKNMPSIDRFMLEESDIITFHNYGELKGLRERIQELKRYGRPILCTEYMARTNGSTFDPILPLLKEEQIGAYNWGLVAGKSQTIYPWDSWRREYTSEPRVWFHDILRKDGTPFDSREVELIRRLTGR